MEISQLEDIINKITLKCSSYITNYFFDDGDFAYNSEIYERLHENFDLLQKGPIDIVKKKIANIIVSCFSLDFEGWELAKFYENALLEIASNDFIVEDTYLRQDNIKEIDFKSLVLNIEKSFESLSTYKREDTNSYLLQKIDVNLYNTLITHPNLLKTLNWRIFEKLIADVVESFGYEVELMQGSKDNGIDVIAIKNVDTFGIHRYLIQAKRWTNKVGVEPVQQLLFKQSDIGATKACIVTTSHFTNGAWLLANKYKYSLELKDFEKVQEWIKIAAILKTKFNIDDL